MVVRNGGADHEVGRTIGAVMDDATDELRARCSLDPPPTHPSRSFDGTIDEEETKWAGSQ